MTKRPKDTDNDDNESLGWDITDFNQNFDLLEIRGFTPSPAPSPNILEDIGDLDVFTLDNLEPIVLPAATAKDSSAPKNVLMPTVYDIPWFNHANNNIVGISQIKYDTNQYEHSIISICDAKQKAVECYLRIKTDGDDLYLKIMPPDSSKAPHPYNDLFKTVLMNILEQSKMQINSKGINPATIEWGRDGSATLIKRPIFNVNVAPEPPTTSSSKRRKLG
jgi:hypothetical protein